MMIHDSLEPPLLAKLNLVELHRQDLTRLRWAGSDELAKPAREVAGALDGRFGEVERDALGDALTELGVLADVVEEGVRRLGLGGGRALGAGSGARRTGGRGGPGLGVTA